MSRLAKSALRDRLSDVQLRLSNVVRHVAIGDASALEWVLEGLSDDEGNIENPKADVFAGVGFMSRPRAKVETEAVVLNVAGDQNHPLIVGSRDPELDQKFVKAESPGHDMSALYNSLATLHVLPDGTIVARSLGGTAVPLALKSDLTNFITNTFDTHTHLDPVSGSTGIASNPGAATAVVGTEKLLAE